MSWPWPSSWSCGRRMTSWTRWAPVCRCSRTWVGRSAANWRNRTCECLLFDVTKEQNSIFQPPENEKLKFFSMTSLVHFQFGCTSHLHAQLAGNWSKTDFAVFKMGQQHFIKITNWEKCFWKKNQAFVYRTPGEKIYACETFSVKNELSSLE